MQNNLILLTDSYKTSHYNQYPPKTTQLYCYLSARKAECLFFGLQYIIKKYLVGQVITKEKIAEAKDVIDKHMGTGIFNEEGWNYILEHHKGYLPIRIYAVEEGKFYDKNQILMVITNTDAKCAWLVTYLETILLQVWYPCSVATQSLFGKRIIKDFLLQTADNLDGLDFKLHDFGCRGVSSMESAAIGGAAYLVNFKGTNTMPALSLIKDYYNSDICAYSIPAAEHSTICSWSQNNESKAYEHILSTYLNNMVSIVSDSYNIFNACDKLYHRLMPLIAKREQPFVIRPDSGDPIPQILRLFEIIEDRFGGIIYNKKSYKLLPPYIRFIWGDGINLEMIRYILEILEEEGWSADNIAFGMGGRLLQHVTRDDLGFAYKCAIAVVDGLEKAVFKQPFTDNTKSSYVFNSAEELLSKVHEREIYINGTLLTEISFEQVRENANTQ
jgi:nicotinamide phosphoribosyltransferase